MKYKEAKLKTQIQKANSLLRRAISDFEYYSYLYAGVEPVVTRVTDSVDHEETNVHSLGLAIDFRNEYGKEKLYTDRQANKICKEINNLYPRNDGLKTLIVHGKPQHFHLQIVVNPKAMMRP